jgi:hypothetical protein
MDSSSRYDCISNFGGVSKMKPIKTETANRTYIAKGCEALPATAIQFADGKIVTEACFELDENEVEEITASKRIYISFVGETIIPFMLHTKSNALINQVQDKTH